MAVNIQSFLQAVLTSEHLRGADQHRRPLCSGCVITVSRERGTGGGEIAAALARYLNIPLFDKALLEAIERESGISAEKLRAIDEQLRGMHTNWLELLWTNKPEVQAKYRKNLINAILGVTRTGGVIVGRGANFILGSHALKVRVIGSLERRTAWLAQHDGIDRDTARREIERVDRDREGFCHALYGRDAGAPVHYDLLINTDRFNPSQAVDLIVEALHIAAPETTHREAAP
ncbi:MAG: AAA family ATPase [Thiotrichales bacterium]